MTGKEIDDGWQQTADALLGRIAPILDAARSQVVRTVYLAYCDRIPHPLGGESARLAISPEIPHPLGEESPRAFSPHLSWSHYRALMRVADDEARGFYESEAVQANWSRLKIGELTHQDIGQMDGYVRLYEELNRIDGDNPTIGLILCCEKNEAVARYSVLHESQQLFASRYRFTLPSEEELQSELERERALIEDQMDSGA